MKSKRRAIDLDLECESPLVESFLFLPLEGRGLCRSTLPSTSSSGRDEGCVEHLGSLEGWVG